MRLSPTPSRPGVPTAALAVLAALGGLGALGAGCGSAGSPSTAHPAHPAQAARPASTTTTQAAPSRLSATEEPWHLPAPVSRPVVLPDGSGFVILGGLATGDVSTSRIVQVDPGTGTSQLAGRLALAVHDSAGAVIGGRWYVFGGGSYSTVATVQAWSSGTATEQARLPDARSDLSA